MRAIFDGRIPYPETVPVLPDISAYRLQKTIVDIDLHGIVVPGLTGRFFERAEGAAMATAGVYSLAGQELFISWGYRHQAHCSFTAYRVAAGWTTPHPGCPRISFSENALFLGTGRTRMRVPVAMAIPSGT